MPRAPKAEWQKFVDLATREVDACRRDLDLWLQYGPSGDDWTQAQIAHLRWKIRNLESLAATARVREEPPTGWVA